MFYVLNMPTVVKSSGNKISSMEQRYEEYTTTMNNITCWLVWLSRIHHCRGFGIQSPTDYAFVRYVVNEHWPYYAYDDMGQDDWLTQKLGRLYFRLANWRQPRRMVADRWQPYWQAGCRRTQFVTDAGILTTGEEQRVELARIEISDRDAWETLVARCDERSVVVVEGLWRDKRRWQTIMRDERVGTTFDLYYCGIVWFDRQRPPHHYVINF